VRAERHGLREIAVLHVLIDRAARKPCEPVFVQADSPTDENLQALLHKIITRLMKLMTRRGVLIEEEEESGDLALEHCPNCGGQLKTIAAILEAPGTRAERGPAPRAAGRGCV